MFIEVDKFPDYLLYYTWRSICAINWPHTRKIFSIVVVMYQPEHR